MQYDFQFTALCNMTSSLLFYLHATTGIHICKRDITFSYFPPRHHILVVILFVFFSLCLFSIYSPCMESHYKDARILADKIGVPVIALNSPYSYLYDIGEVE